MSPHDLTMENLPLAEVIAFEYANIPGCIVDDARAEAYSALMRASATFDPLKGEFTRFAARVIRNALNSLYAKQLRLARLFPISLDDPIQWNMSGSLSSSDSSSEGFAPCDAKQDVVNAVRRRETLAALESVLGLLSPRERIMVNAVRSGQSYEDIGKSLGVTKQAAHKTVKSSLTKLRQGLARMGYNGVASDGHLGSTTRKAD
ncbi:MAG: sigma-70 family RNA polymerase sigma factor [Armatimonadaceae bacterium]